MEYTDANGRTWMKILSWNSLSKAMIRKYGANWKHHVIDSYGREQLGL